jgi:hypothetical protein
MQLADQTINREIEKFQGRLTTCVKVCQDSIEAKQTPSSEPAKLEAEFNACALTCLQTNTKEGIPQMKTRLDAVLKNLKQ